MSKQGERRNKCPKKCKINLSSKTGPLKDKLKDGYKPHINAIMGNPETNYFIPKTVK
jgi:hypothetical protein